MNDSTLTPEWWRRVRTALDEALALDEPRRADFLRRLVEQDHDVAAEVRALVRRHDEPAFLTGVPRGAWRLLNADEDDALAGESCGPEWPSLIGPYQVQGEVARGGMGIVLRVTDAKFGRPLALKILASKHRSNHDLKQMFHQEARLMGQLQHPGIPPVHDLGELPDGRPYFVMKLIKGRTLEELLRERTVVASDATTVVNSEPGHTAPHEARFIQVFEKICETIAYAHERKVLNLDLKPRNVMVGAYGEVQVIDWGAAKIIEDDHDHGVSTVFVPAAKTTSAGAMGTLAYMAPEHARGEIENLDRRCDVFGLGATLCEILTGLPPFKGATASETRERAKAGAVKEAFKRLDECRADAELIELAKKCLAPERDKRPSNAAVVAAAVIGYQAALEQRLRRVEIEQAAARVRSEEQRKRRRLRAGVLGLVVLACAAAVGVYIERQQHEHEVNIGKVHDQVRSALRQEEDLANKLNQQLADPLEVHTLLSNLDLWDENLKARERTLAEAASRDSLSAELKKTIEERLGQLEKDFKDLATARDLDDIHLRSFVFVEGEDWDLSAAVQNNEAFAKKFPLDIGGSSPAAVAKQIQDKHSRLRYVLVAALDHWADVSESVKATEQTARLLEISRLADKQDPWRVRFRHIDVWKDRKQLEVLAEELADKQEPWRARKDRKQLEVLAEDLKRDTALTAQPPSVIVALASQLTRLHDRELPKARRRDDERARRELARSKGLDLLQHALVVHAGDFWINLTVANLLPEPEQKSGYYHAALALRPKSSVAWNMLGVSLFQLHKHQVAIAAHLEAVRHNPKDSDSHRLIANVCLQQGDFDEAEKSLRKAEELLAKDNRARWRVIDQLKALAVQRQEKKEAPLALVAGSSLPVAGVLTSAVSDFFPLTRNSYRKAHPVRLASDKSYQIDLVAPEKTIDPLLRIETEQFQPVLANDDVGGLLDGDDFNARVVFTPPKDGVYRLVVNSFGPREEGAYRLTVREVIGSRELQKKIDDELGKVQQPPGEPRREEQQPKLIQGRFIHGHEIELIAQTPYVFELTSDQFDTVLRLVHPRGLSIENDDVTPGNFGTSRIDFTPATSGKYTLQVTSFRAAETGPYTLNIQGFRPPQEGSAKATR